MRPVSTEMRTINPLNLHACPFCKSEDVDSLSKDEAVFICCLDCGARGPKIYLQMGGMTKKEAAIEAWQALGKEGES